MKKYILLMRHAKSSWDHPGLKDFDRPLNKRGEKDGPRMAKFLKETGYLPDRIISSPAKRTTLTAEFITKHMNQKQPVIWDKMLYEGTEEHYLNAVKNAPEKTEKIMLIGHNPTMEETAARLCCAGRGNIRMPTAALACFEGELERWEDLDKAYFELKWYVIPKLLKKLS